MVESSVHVPCNCLTSSAGSGAPLAPQPTSKPHQRTSKQCETASRNRSIGLHLLGASPGSVLIKQIYRRRSRQRGLFHLFGYLLFCFIGEWTYFMTRRPALRYRFAVRVARR